MQSPTISTLFHRISLCVSLCVSAVTTAHASTPSTLYTNWYTPLSQQTAVSALQLQQTLSNYCSQAEASNSWLQKSRLAWGHSVQDWEHLASVAMGPLIDRRTSRTVDFHPLRPALLKKAIQQQPSSQTAMEEIGGPAKGFAAIEYLLWTDIAKPRSPACDYMVMAAADITQEFQELHADFTATTHTTPADFFILEDFINQWMGGLERLRWQNMEKPLRSATTQKQPRWVREASSQTLNSWRAEWQGLRTLALSAPDAASMRIASLVHTKGWENLAQRFTDAIYATDKAMAKLDLQAPATIEEAAKRMSELKHLVEKEIAPALDVTLGFSDSDGD